MSGLTKKCSKCISGERSNEIIQTKQYKKLFQAEDENARALVIMYSSTTVEERTAKMPFRAEMLGSIFRKINRYGISCYIIDQLNHIREEKCKMKTRHGRLWSKKREKMYTTVTQTSITKMYTTWSSATKLIMEAKSEPHLVSNFSFQN